MALSAEDIERFIEIVRKDPELRERVFRAIVEEEFLALPARVAAMDEKWERRLSRIEAILEQVAERQARTEQELAAFREATELRFQKVEEEITAFREATDLRFRKVEEEIAAFREATDLRFRKVEEEIARFREATELRFKRVEEELRAFREGAETRFQRMDAQLASLIGWQWEEHYAKHIYAYFAPFLRGLRVLIPSDLDPHVQDALTREEIKDLYQADVLARGRARSAPDEWVYVVVEVSRVIDEGDVARARRRADLMRKAGLPCLAAVGGERITDNARLEARHSQVLIALDGEMQEGWQDALITASPGESG